MSIKAEIAAPTAAGICALRGWEMLLGDVSSCHNGFVKTRLGLVLQTMAMLSAALLELSILHSDV